MKLAQTGIGRSFTAELKRLSLLEDKSMDEICEEIARLVGLRGERQVYNWRAGRWPLPSNVIPTLCRRFKSRALLNALADECADVEIEIPENYDLTREVSQTVRQDLLAYEGFLKAFDDDSIEPHELQELRELMEKVIANAHRFLDIAATNCERRTAVLIGSNQ